MTEPSGPGAPGPSLHARRTPAETLPPQEWLVSCSPDRTLVARRNNGTVRLLKIFETGSLDDARAEARLGRMLAIDGLIQCGEAGVDSITGKPCVPMDYHEGVDLEEWVAQRGPLCPLDAARIGTQIARILRQLHDLTSLPQAPSGIVHRDVKPANVLLVGEPPTARVFLLDLEHAASRDGGAVLEPTTFTGGTHGWSPPEAYEGARPDVTFDVFGLGATLHFMLTGAPLFAGEGRRLLEAARAGARRTHALAGLPAALVNVVERCLDPLAAHRPSVSSLEQVLTQLLVRNDRVEDLLDAALRCLHEADLLQCAAKLDEAHRLRPHDPRHQELRALSARRGRLLTRMPEQRLFEAPADTLDLARAIAAQSPALLACLRRFPAATSALGARRQMREAGTRLLREVPPAVAVLKREARFDRAVELLEATLTAAHALRAFGGTLPLPADVRRPGPLERDPIRFLGVALEDAQSGGSAHHGLLAAFEDAQARLDVTAAARALDSIAGVYSGANEVVASLKDRLHRLGFFVERLAQPEQRLQTLQAELAAAALDVDLTPVRELLGTCRERSGAGAEPRAQLSPRALHRMLHDLLADFPRAVVVAGPAALALDRAFDELTQRAWNLLEDASRKLSAVPIPIRPLQTAINRIDSLRLMEALVDRPGRPRSALLEELERVRTKVDQARATRDAIARGAREAMQRGHFTTALYDMSRAVDQFAEDGNDTGGADPQLVEQLEETRRKKEAVDDALLENRSLAGRYAELQDAAASSPQERLAALEKRRGVLGFLLQNLQPERAVVYAQDLREVEVSIVQERSEEAERLLDGTTALDRRVDIARRTLASLGGVAADQTSSMSIGRVQRIVEHWQHHLEHALEAARARDRQASETEARRRRRAWLRILQAAALLVLLCGVYQVSHAMSREDPLQWLAASVAPELREPFTVDRSQVPARFDELRALVVLNGFVAQLEKAPLPPATFPSAADVLARAKDCLTTLDTTAAGAAGATGEAWLAALDAAVARYAGSVASLGSELGSARSAIVPTLQRFASMTRLAGIYVAAARSTSPAQRDAVRRHARAPIAGAPLPAALEDDLQAFWR